jgi:hypothetical protein
MATERTTPNQRRLLVGLLVLATSLAAILGIVAVDAGGERKTTTADATRPAPAPTETVRPATSHATTTEAPDGVATTTTESPVAVDTSTVAADGGDPVGDPDPAIGSTEACRADPTCPSSEHRTAIGSTEACRADPTCPSSEHRTGDLCGATLIVDQGGYLEGRRDAEQGLPYRIDGAPAPSPEDDDDDDATVGPQTAYRGGYVQGWCDGGGEQPASH